MSRASIETIQGFHPSIVTRTEIEYLSDRLFARGISTLTTTTPAEQCDLILASRALRRLLAAYERNTGRQLHTIMLAGGC